MTPRTQNLLASFTGAAIGVLIEHSQPIAVLYGVGGFVVGPWILGRVRQMANRSPQNTAAVSTPENVPDYRL